MLARQAQAKATDPRVRELGFALENERTARLAKVIHVMNDENTGSEQKANDYDLARLRQLQAQFDTMPSGMNWDVAFTKVQFFEAQNEIDVLNANRASEEDLRDRVEYSLKMLTGERERARELVSALGASLP